MLETTVWPMLTRRLTTTPSTGDLMVVYSRLRISFFSAASACFREASASCREASATATLAPGGFFIRNILVVAGFGQGIPRPQLFRAFPVQSGLLVLGFGLLDVRLGAGDSGNGLRFGGFRPLNVQLHGKLVDFREHLTGFYRAGIIHHLAVQVLAELHDDSADLGAYIYQFIRLRDAGCFDGDHQVSFFKRFCLVVHGWLHFLSTVPRQTRCLRERQ